MEIEIPKGWKQVEPFDDIVKGDLYHDYNAPKEWNEVDSAIGHMAIEYGHYVIIRFVGIGSGYLRSPKRYRSIDDE